MQLTARQIKQLRALEILDSRGRPTLKASCVLDDGSRGAASVPSGASTGIHEAMELRDGDLAWFGGLGCRQAVKNIEQEIFRALSDKRFSHQSELDQFLMELDGTTNKSKLGANAILACSLAFARAMSASRQIPLFAYFGALIDKPEARLPQLTVNLFSGGKHAGGQVAMQDVLVVPRSAKTVYEALSMVYAVYQSAAALIREKYNMRALTADEGGLAPQVADDEAMLALAVQAIEKAGLKAGTDVALAIDVASSHFFRDGIYRIQNQRLNGSQMVELISDWVQRYPIVSVEDGLAEEDWRHWSELKARLDGQCLVLGDDLLCTNPKRIKKAIREKAADALLLKVNQIGTLTEAAEAMKLARSADWHVTVSARSGETEDNWLADLAYGWAGDQIKIGSITQSERLAKYNRLLELEKWEGSEFGQL